MGLMLEEMSPRIKWYLSVRWQISLIFCQNVTLTFKRGWRKNYRASVFFPVLKALSGVELRLLALGGAVFMFTNFFHCETFLVFLLRGISFELVIYIFQGFLSSILNGLYSPLNKYSSHHASFFDCHFTHGLC